jgi:hypothetical protein
MTSGSAEKDGGFADALFGSDGTYEPRTPPEPAVVYADPLADLQSDGTASMTSSLTAPDAITRVAGPPPLSNEAVLAAEQRLARERAQLRASARTEEQLADRTRRATLDQARQAAQRRAADQAALRSGQHAQVAAAYRARTSAQMTAANAPSAAPARPPAPVTSTAAPARPSAPYAQTAAPVRPSAPFRSTAPPRPSARSTAAPAYTPAPVNPPADRSALLERLRSATGPERRQAMRDLMAQSRAARARSGKKGSSGWGCALALIVLLLGATGAGRELIQHIAELFPNGR